MVLEERGKFDFNGKPDKKLKTKPLHTDKDGNKYFGQ